MKSFLWTLTVIGSVLGGLVALVGVWGATGAPQEAAAAAIGVACAVIPYCLARAVSEINDSTSTLVVSIAENLVAIRKNTSQAPSNESKTTTVGSNEPILPPIRQS